MVSTVIAPARRRGCPRWGVFALAALVDVSVAQVTAPDDAPAAKAKPPAVWPATALRPDSSAPAAPGEPAEDLEHRRRSRTLALVIASVGGTAAYGRAKWWQDGLSGRFKTVNEGWFGQDTHYGGADKLGHAMFAYTGTRLLTRAFEWAGNDPASALKLGLWTAVSTLMGVEVVDGFSNRWRFSKEDALVNLAGGALAYWIETNPAVDDWLDLRLQYSASTGPEGRRRFDPFGDYSGQRYLMVFKASGVPALRRQPLWRYVEFSVGYGARDFDADARGRVMPTRHVYYGVSLNLTELLRSTAFKGNATPSRTQRFAETFFEFVQVPAAAAQGERTIR